MAFAPLTAQAAEEKYLAMTFDDGPSGRFTRRLLEELEGRQSRVTFFLCGYRLEQYPDMAGRMLEAGHEIGLHGYSHACMENMSPEKLEWELSKTEALLREQTGTTSYLLRPPGGQTNQAVIHAAESHGLSLITWSVDPKDWATSNREKVLRGCGAGNHRPPGSGRLSVRHRVRAGQAPGQDHGGWMLVYEFPPRL